MKSNNIPLLLFVLYSAMTGFSCATNSGIARAPLLSRRIPSIIQLSPIDSSFNHRRDFTLQQDVSFLDDSGKTTVGSLASDTTSLAAGEIFVATMLSSGKAHLDELPIRSEHRFSMARAGTTWLGKLKSYTIQRVDTIVGKRAMVVNEMRTALLFDVVGDVYVLDFLPGCKFELFDEDSDNNGDFLRLGDDFEYSFSGNSGIQIPYYLLGRPAIARILHVEYIKRTR